MGFRAQGYVFPRKRQIHFDGSYIVEIDGELHTLSELVDFWRENHNKRNINQELLDPIWEDMKSLSEINPKHANDPFIKAIIGHNAETLYNLVSQSVHKDRYKIAIKRILSKLI